MSDTDESKAGENSDVVAGKPVPATGRARGGIAWLAILFASLAMLFAGYTAYRDWRTQRDLALSSDNIEASFENLASRIDAAQLALAARDAELAALQQADRNASNRIDLMQRDLDERLQRLDALPVRTSNLETAIAALQGLSEGARDTWLLGEAEYYMQLANAQLQLAGNPELASLALGFADERIAQMANPALTNVRIAIADERAALAGMATPDVEGITLQLASVARTVASMPLRQPAPEADADTAESPADLGPLDRAWYSVKQVAAGMVSHRRVDENIMPLISPEAEPALRANLVLQLQSARLALLRSQHLVYASSLSDAADWLQAYFDSSDDAVRSALQTVADLRDAMPQVATPDISGSLQLLRQYSAIAERTR